MQTLPESYLVSSNGSPNFIQLNMKKQRIYVFDLDDTLIQTTKYDPEFWQHDFHHLQLYKNAGLLLQKLGKENCILLTYDQHGLQQDKIDKLNLTDMFREIHIVKDKIDKFIILRKLKEDNLGEKEVVVIGDRHEGGELQYGKALGLKTVCVAIEGGFHFDKNYHRQHNLIIEKEEDFLKILDLE